VLWVGDKFCIDIIFIYTINDIELTCDMMMTRVDNDNHFASFFAKTWLQTIIVFREKMTRLSG
jgi:hypothetical protein